MADSGYLAYLKKKIMCLKKDRLKDEARKRNLSQSGTKAKLVKRIIGGEIGGAEANLKTVKKNGIKISLKKFMILFVLHVPWVLYLAFVDPQR